MEISRSRRATAATNTSASGADMSVTVSYSRGPVGLTHSPAPITHAPFDPCPSAFRCCRSRSRSACARSRACLACAPHSRRGEHVERGQWPAQQRLSHRSRLCLDAKPLRLLRRLLRLGPQVLGLGARLVDDGVPLIILALALGDQPELCGHLVTADAAAVGQSGAYTAMASISPARRTHMTVRSSLSHGENRCSLASSSAMNERSVASTSPRNLVFCW